MAARWTELVIGIIMIISPWVFGFSGITVARWCDVLLGVVITVISAWAVFGTPKALPVSEEAANKNKSNKK